MCVFIDEGRPVLKPGLSKPRRYCCPGHGSEQKEEEDEDRLPTSRTRRVGLADNIFVYLQFGFVS